MNNTTLEGRCIAPQQTKEGLKAITVKGHLYSIFTEGLGLFRGMVTTGDDLSKLVDNAYRAGFVSIMTATTFSKLAKSSNELRRDNFAQAKLLDRVLVIEDTKLRNNNPTMIFIVNRKHVTLKARGSRFSTVFAGADKLGVNFAVEDGKRIVAVDSKAWSMSGIGCAVEVLAGPATGADCAFSCYQSTEYDFMSGQTFIDYTINGVSPWEVAEPSKPVERVVEPVVEVVEVVAPVVIPEAVESVVEPVVEVAELPEPITVKTYAELITVLESVKLNNEWDLYATPAAERWLRFNSDNSMRQDKWGNADWLIDLHETVTAFKVWPITVFVGAAVVMESGLIIYLGEAPAKPVESVVEPVVEVVEVEEDEGPVTMLEVLAANGIHLVAEAEHDWNEEVEGTVFVLNGPEEDIWDMVPPVYEVVTLPSLEAKEAARCWSNVFDGYTFHYNQAARAAGLDYLPGALVEVEGFDGPALFLEKDTKVVRVVLLVDEFAPTFVEVEGRVYAVPPMPTTAPTMPTPMADLVQSIFEEARLAEEAEREHVIPYPADDRCYKKRLFVGVERAEWLAALLDFSEEWLLVGLEQVGARPVKTRWAEYVREEFGVVESVAVEPVSGHIVFYGSEAAAFANVPEDYLFDDKTFKAVCRWLHDMESVDV